MKSPENRKSTLILKYRIKKDGPYEFVLDIVDNNIRVLAIFQGGIIWKHGGLRPGDNLLAVNEMSLEPEHFGEAIYKLESVMEDKSTSYLELTISRDVRNEPEEEVTSL